MNANFTCPKCGKLFMKARECPSCKIATKAITTFESKEYKLNLVKG